MLLRRAAGRGGGGAHSGGGWAQGRTGREREGGLRCDIARIRRGSPGLAVDGRRHLRQPNIRGGALVGRGPHPLDPRPPLLCRRGILHEERHPHVAALGAAVRAAATLLFSVPPAGSRRSLTVTVNASSTIALSLSASPDTRVPPPPDQPEAKVAATPAPARATRRAGPLRHHRQRHPHDGIIPGPPHLCQRQVNLAADVLERLGAVV
mmetsp:Transcript_21500/g.53188  ORF Transcript_21500/g.53188 Transcript_21500/m.53188 type:complete len:208 (-) Transcript_21500:279-902(-)